MSTSDKSSSRKQIASERSIRRLDVNLHDLSVGFWQGDANDPTFRVEVFQGLIRHLRRRGWKVGPDEEIAKRYRSLAPDYRRCAKGPFLATLRVSGRVVDFEAWAETWPKENPNGHRYDFRKRNRLGFLDRLRFDLEVRHLLDWARARFTITVKDQDVARGPHRGGLTAMAWIAKDYAESPHVPVRPGWPRPAAYNMTSAEGGALIQGAEVWLRGRNGRWLRGRAYAHINNMWWVVLGLYDVENRCSRELHLCRPANLREKVDPRRRARLESEWTRAVRGDDYARAALLKNILLRNALLTVEDPLEAPSLPSIDVVGLLKRVRALPTMSASLKTEIDLVLAGAAHG